MYVAIDKKPENGVDIHNASCGWFRITMRLRIVKSARNDAEQEENEENTPYGTKVMKKLVLPWDNTDRIVCEDSYFSSVLDVE